MPDCAEKVASFELEVFFDGECPLCQREIRMLKRWDSCQRVRFTDIAATGFDAKSVGVDHDQLMAEIHARLPNGQLICGVEVFRLLYAVVGFRRLANATRCPGISHLLEFGYRVFARNRLRWTGRCNSTSCASTPS